MKNAIAGILVFILCLSLCACGNADTIEIKEPVEESTMESKFDAEVIDKLLQGTWVYHDPTIGSYSVILFENGKMQDTHWLSAYPEKATTSNATYTLDDGYIYLYFPETDYKNTLEYYWVGSELIVCFYVGSGRDEGNTRIYQKQDHGQETSGITIPDKVPSKKEIPSSTKSITSGMKNALQSAKDYLAVMPFSHSGLVEQLEYEGYSHSEATYAADNCGADWYAQAVKSARNYLDVMSFSRSGLIEQLEYEGFTHDQAVYGVDKVY